MGKGWGAAKDKLVGTITGFFTGAGKMGKMVWDWITKGGLWGLLKNVGGGIASVFKWIFSGPGGGGLLDLLGNVAGGIKALAKFIFVDAWVLIWKGSKAVVGYLWNWLKGGGLMELGKGIAGGAMSILKWLLFNAVPWAVKAAGNAGKALLEWFQKGAHRFINNFPKIMFPTQSIGEMFTGLFDKFLGPVMDWKMIPNVSVKVKPGDSSKWAIDPRRHFGGVEVKAKLQSLRDLLSSMTWGIPDILGGIFKHIPGLKNLVKDGKVEGIPNLALLTPPGLPFLIPHFTNSFFPGAGAALKNAATGFKGESPPPKEGSTAEGKKDDDTASGITPTPDNSKGDDTVKGQGAAAASADASSISESASYDKKGGGGKGGIVPIPVGQMKGAGAAGGKGNAIIQTSVNKYEVINGFKKTMILAELYKG
jgi:hypothetical protein